MSAVRFQAISASGKEAINGVIGPHSMSPLAVAKGFFLLIEIVTQRTHAGTATRVVTTTGPRPMDSPNIPPI